MVGAYIIKPAGKPVLVPLSDKRNGFHSKDEALAAFAEVEEDEIDI